MKKPLVVITGASSGIGKAAAIEFSSKGYPLLLIARRLELIESLKLPNTICAKVDVKNYQEFKNAIEEAERKYGPVDLLINNAGIMPLDKIYNQDLNDQYEIIDINVKGVLNGMNIVISNMKQRQHGTIINVSSVAGRYTFEDHAVYCGSKYAVHAITEQARKELGQFNVRFCIVAPAIVDTDLLVSVKNKEVLDSYQEYKISINNGLLPQDIAEMMLYVYQLPQRVSIKEIVTSATQDLC